MVNKNYLLAVKNLTVRNKNRLNTQRSPMQQEIDDLFYWIISRFEWSIQDCLPARNTHTVIVEEHSSSTSNFVLLEHGRTSEYRSQYVTREDFYFVMQEVANAFNEIGKNEKYGYTFYAKCSIKNRKSSLVVNMTTTM